MRGRYEKPPLTPKELEDAFNACLDMVKRLWNENIKLKRQLADEKDAIVTVNYRKKHP